MPDKKKPAHRVNQRRINMNGSAWSPYALDVAHGILRTYGTVEIVLVAPKPPEEPTVISFNLHPALDAWSAEQLKPKQKA